MIIEGSSFTSYPMVVIPSAQLYEDALSIGLLEALVLHGNIQAL
jgi:hypothetical protein